MDIYDQSLIFCYAANTCIERYEPEDFIYEMNIEDKGYSFYIFKKDKMVYVRKYQGENEIEMTLQEHLMIADAILRRYLKNDGDVVAVKYDDRENLYMVTYLKEEDKFSLDDIDAKIVKKYNIKFPVNWKDIKNGDFLMPEQEV